MTLDFSNNYSEDFDYLLGNFDKIMEITKKKLSLADNYYLGVVLVDNKTIHEINKTYRNIDRPTDVISFAFQDDKQENINSPEIVNLGEIYISIDKCKEQSLEYNHSFDRESAFLFTHGLLHLLGYDHMNEKDEEKMFKLQDEILEETPWKKKN